MGWGEHVLPSLGDGRSQGCEVGWDWRAGASSEPTQQTARTVRDKVELLCWLGLCAFRPGLALPISPPALILDPPPQAFCPELVEGLRLLSFDFLPAFEMWLYNWHLTLYKCKLYNGWI